MTPYVFLFLSSLVVSNALLWTAEGSLSRQLAALWLLVIPGLAWMNLLAPDSSRWLRLAVGAGLGYAWVMVLGLLLHYLPGLLPLWGELVALDLATAIPLLLTASAASKRVVLPDRQSAGLTIGWPAHLRDALGSARRGVWQRLRGGEAGWLLVVLIVAAGFRFVELDYSEFQGDEALAMISAAEVLEGQADTLFLRGKGPGEVLLPAMLWRLTGTIDEAGARLPFAWAGWLTVLTGYLLGANLFARAGLPDKWTGLIGAGLLALNGFMVGFSRIVQYQVVVIWFSGLAVLCAWQWRMSGRVRWLVLGGALLGAGCLAHYDAILVVPALGYLIWSAGRGVPVAGRATRRLPAALLGVGSLLLVVGPFYLPYLLDTQASHTGGYLGSRIGGALLKNNLDSFQQFNVFYTSFYYYALTGLLVLGYVAWTWQQAPWVRWLPAARYWVPVAIGLLALATLVWPQLWRSSEVDWAAVPFALILLGAILSTAADCRARTALIWLAVPFWGYNFGVALPLTHIYTLVPAWALLAGLAATRLGARWIQAPGLSRARRWMLLGCAGALAGLFGGYLFVAYLRQDVEYWQDWPRSRPAVYWSPYAEAPVTGFFGFAHRTGWKAVGALFTAGRLLGDYSSNEEADVTAWYTRNAPRACDARPEYYLIADDVVDARPVDMRIVQAEYGLLGRVVLPNGKGLTIYQARPLPDQLGALELDELSLAFDRSAVPSAFSRTARGAHSTEVNLGGSVRLVGYDAYIRRAYPGGRLAVTLYWQAIAPLGEDYHVFVHLENDGSRSDLPGIWGQSDGRPVCWSYPTFDWRPGQIIADHHALMVRPDTPAGEYPLLVGMYRPDTGRRLEVLDRAGKPAGDFAQLLTVHIRR